MKNLSLFLIALLLVSCGPTIYKATGLNESRNTIKTLAILPFNVTINTKRMPRGTSIQTIEESQEKTGYDIQNDAYTWLLQRQRKYSVTFQDIDRTNALLKNAGITYDNLPVQDKGKLCKILGVNGILSGDVTLSRPMSEGAAIATGLLIGIGGTTNKATATLTIHDMDSNLLWRYAYEAGGGIFSNAEKLTNDLMKNASKKFPYTWKGMEKSRR